MNEASIAMTPLLVSLNLGDANDMETLRAQACKAHDRALDSLEIPPGSAGMASSPRVKC